MIRVYSCVPFVFIALFLNSCLSPRKDISVIPSPDNRYRVRIETVWEDESQNPESRIAVWTIDGDLLDSLSFISKSHVGGRAIVKNEWTPNGKYFAFSTISSGGNEPGFFPTYVYSIFHRRFYLLDTLMHLQVTNPDFEAVEDELILLGGKDMFFPHDSIARAAHLDSLIR